MLYNKLKGLHHSYFSLMADTLILIQGEEVVFHRAAGAGDLREAGDGDVRRTPGF